MAQDYIYDINSFDAEGYADKLPRGWRVIHVFTGNEMDNCYIDLPAMDSDETAEAIRSALRSKYGRHYCYEGYEDVTNLYKSVEGWTGEGWYRIGWSDGGMDWTNDGPVWFDDASELEDELKAASQDETETHLAYAEYIGCGKGPEEGQSARYERYMLEAYLGDFADDYDLDAIEWEVRDRWAYLSEEELEAIIEECELDAPITLHRCEPTAGNPSGHHVYRLAGSGSGKTFQYVKTTPEQLNASYLIIDPKAPFAVDRKYFAEISKYIRIVDLSGMDEDAKAAILSVLRNGNDGQDVFEDEEE